MPGTGMFQTWNLHSTRKELPPIATPFHLSNSSQQDHKGEMEILRTFRMIPDVLHEAVLGKIESCPNKKHDSWHGSHLLERNNLYSDCWSLIFLEVAFSIDNNIRSYNHSYFIHITDTFFFSNKIQFLLDVLSLVACLHVIPLRLRPRLEPSHPSALYLSNYVWKHELRLWVLPT